jgi:hypothetical protein
MHERKQEEKAKGPPKTTNKGMGTVSDLYSPTQLKHRADRVVGKNAAHSKATRKPIPVQTTILLYAHAGGFSRENP